MNKLLVVGVSVVPTFWFGSTNKTHSVSSLFLWVCVRVCMCLCERDKTTWKKGWMVSAQARERRTLAIQREATTNCVASLNSIKWLTMANGVQEWPATPLTGLFTSNTIHKLHQLTWLTCFVCFLSKRIQKTVQQRKLRLHMDSSVSVTSSPSFEKPTNMFYFQH